LNIRYCALAIHGLGFVKDCNIKIITKLAMNFINAFKQSKHCTLDTLLNVLVVLNLIFLVKVIYYVTLLYHLPPPFYYDPNNTFFDFFEIGRMSFKADLFSEFSPNYLPFVFGLAQLLSPLGCDLINPYNYRSCALPAILWMVSFYMLAAFLLGRYLRRAHHIKENFQTLLKIDFIVLTSPILLFALERGNYIVLTLLLLVIYEFTKAFWARTILAILLINIKIYMLILLLPMLLKGYYKKIVIILFGVIVSNILVSHLFNYAFTWEKFMLSLIGFESPIHIGGHAPIGYLTERLWTNVSIENLLKVTSADNVGVACQYVSQTACEVLKTLSGFHLAPLWKLSVAFFSGMTLLTMSWLYKKNKVKSVVTEEMMLFYLILSLMMFVSHIGAYVLILLIPYLFLLPRYSLGVIVSFVILFTTLTDIPFYPSSIKEYFSFIGQTYYTATHTIQLSSYLRPLALTYLFYFYTKLIFNAYLSVPKRLRPL
jgi:hypothetical protein